MDELDFIWALRPWLLLGLGLFFCAYLCRWPLFSALGLEAYRIEIIGGPADAEPDGKGPVYADLYAQLRELGFEPLGVYREQLRGRTGRPEYIFRRPKEDCRATIFRLVGGDPRVIFKTQFTSGLMVRTSNYATPMQGAEDYIVAGVPHTSLEPVLEVHRRNVDLLQSEGHRSRGFTRLEDAAALERAAFYHPAVRRQYLCSMRFILGCKVSLIAVGAVVSALSATALSIPTPGNVGVGLLFGSLVVFASQTYDHWEIARRLTAAQQTAALENGRRRPG